MKKQMEKVKISPAYGLIGHCEYGECQRSATCHVKLDGKTVRLCKVHAKTLIGIAAKKGN